MNISELILHLQVAMNKHGDLPVFTTDDEITSVSVHPCRDGVESHTDGELDKPTDFTIEFNERVTD